MANWAGCFCDGLRGDEMSSRRSPGGEGGVRGAERLSLRSGGEEI